MTDDKYSRSINCMTIEKNSIIYDIIKTSLYQTTDFLIKELKIFLIKEDKLIIKSMSIIEIFKSSIITIK
ncbi:hypothetical protein BpHYR1_032642 [Brachionus plicatilis]|uniref:Uncharacterized protein n=1 Tax=Brachionus plicatilis TaxID=10195 RepID=A0A3M7Q368_BRAPC|nr:hypothetical protein BpHYR1_032642 [Brachionus plicatilis]